MKKSEKIILGVSVGFWSIVIIAFIAGIILFAYSIRNEFMEQYNILELTVETNMPDEMGVNDSFFLKRRLSTEYKVKDAEGETLILHNYQVKAIWGAIRSVILTDLKGNQLSDEYEFNIEYGDYIPAYRDSMVSDRLAVTDGDEDHVHAYTVYGEEVFDGTRNEFENGFDRVFRDEVPVTAKIIEEEGKQYLSYIDYNSKEIFRSDCYIENDWAYTDETRETEMEYSRDGGKYIIVPCRSGYGIIDSTGNVVIDFEYRRIESFMQNYFYAEDHSGQRFIADAETGEVYPLPVLSENFETIIFDGIIVFKNESGVSTVYSAEVR